MRLTIDASVWIAAADAKDLFHQPSRELLRWIVSTSAEIVQPSFARAEVACALARRVRDSTKGRVLTHTVMDRIVTTEVAMDKAFLTAAEDLGTSQFLRGADALYAATAQENHSTLISWDNEHLQRPEPSHPPTG